jgi:glycosyltransferase involved in cell wall biosynthesis
VASIVLPVHNQADHIAAVVRGHLAVLEHLWPRHEVLLVTNGCRDASVEVCVELAAGHPGVRTLDLEQGGWGRAVAAGLDQARGDVLCYANSARTTAETLALMLSYARAYPDIALKANRRLRESAYRRLGSLLYNLEARALFDLAVWDINGTPKVFPRRFDRLLDLGRQDDLIDLEWVVTCQRAGYPIIEVPILSTVRYGGTSTMRLTAAWRMYRGAFDLRRELRGQ